VGEASGSVATRDSSARRTDPAILIEGITKRFGSVTAVDDCSLEVGRGEFVSLLGPSGCGKTTLLRIVGGFETQDGGRVSIQGQSVDRLPPNKRPCNMLFQRYALFPHKSVLENVAFPLELRGVERRERARRVREMLELVHLPGVEERSPEQLSGGQSQRVALARALIGRPPVLLLDEPLTALDLKLRKAMQLELRRIQQELDTTFLYVTHDQEEALTMSDRIVLMNEGRILQQGSPAEIYERPRTVFASRFIGEANLLSGSATSVGSESTRVMVDDDLAILAPASEGTAHRTVTVSIRPQRMTIASRDRQAGEPDNVLEGRVVRRIFLGNLVRWLVEVAPDIVLTVESGADHERLDEGDGVVISWRKQDSLLLEEG
jgi:spermidine/putrescine transport system ATP-binding protein